MSQNVVVLFNKEVIIIKPLMIAVLLMEIAFLGGNAFWKTVEVALQNLLVGGDFPGYLQQVPAGNLKS